MRKHVKLLNWQINNVIAYIAYVAVDVTLPCAFSDQRDREEDEHEDEDQTEDNDDSKDDDDDENKKAA